MTDVPRARRFTVPARLVSFWAGEARYLCSGSAGRPVFAVLSGLVEARVIETLKWKIITNGCASGFVALPAA
jgi:hypothetical protein